MNKTDLTFLKHFAMVIGGLVLLTLVLIVGARVVHQRLPAPTAAQQVAQTDQRIAPVAAVYSGETGQAALQAAQVAAQQATKGQVAYDGSVDGSLIYAKLCGACHASGAAGAPSLNKAQWAVRQQQGFDLLVRHAIDGYQGSAGIMPARGGNPALSDEQIKATVRWMLDNLED
ncbi:MAG: cytochrome c5 family protein [Lysobacterales bacterium]